jgi:hypothetical protein
MLKLAVYHRHTDALITDYKKRLRLRLRLRRINAKISSLPPTTDVLITDYKKKAEAKED